MIIRSHPAFLNYGSKGHMEGSYRLKRFFQTKSATMEEITPDMEKIFLVHTPGYIKKLRRICDHNAFYAEIPTTPSLYESAIISAGLAAEVATSGDFALIRPPGHHAGRDHGNGFCLINNIAVAVTALRDQRVCIIDFDGHHGDGTQGIFAENPNVLYCSVHQENTYPYSGKLEESKGKTARYVNLPVPVGSGDEALAAAIDCFLKKAREFGAEVIAASAGFDGHYNDRLLSLKYTEAGFYEAGRRISQSGMKNFAVLEGGYHHSLHECVLSYVAGINNEPQPRAAKPSLSEDSVREEVKRRIAFLSTADREPR